MKFPVCNATEKQAIKEKIIEIMKKNDIECSILDCCDTNRFCIAFSDAEKECKKCCCDFGIVVQKSDKDICRIYPNNILYITIEDRKSVLYLTDGKVETNYRLDFWKDVLSLEDFAQPHHSFLVNLNYVDEVTKEWVKVKYGEKEYRVYTSGRKIGAFKKTLLEFAKR